MRTSTDHLLDPDPWEVIEALGVRLMDLSGPQRAWLNELSGILQQQSRPNAALEEAQATRAEVD